MKIFKHKNFDLLTKLICFLNDDEQIRRKQVSNNIEKTVSFNNLNTIQFNYEENKNVIKLIDFQSTLIIRDDWL